VHPPADAPEPYDHQRSPETGFVPHAPARWDRSQKRRTFWFKFEMGRSESQREAELGSAHAEAAARPAYTGGIRDWLRRVLLADIESGTQPSPAGTGRPSQRKQTTASPAAGPGGTRATAVSFWEALSQTEREELMSLASWVTFEVGDCLMREGDPADHVIVILEGRTRICVDENGWERVLAERGPGQLVGERGGLQVRVRSASVIAIEPVRALVVSTGDFTAFVGAHLRVLDIVENQLYDRLTEDLVGYWDRYGPGAARSRPVAAQPGDGLTAMNTRPRPLSGQNCTVLLTDVVGFGSPARNDEDRRIIREALFSMTHMTLRGMPDVRSEDRGDGLLTVVPPGVPTANVIERLLKELLPALGRHNGTHRHSARFKLRAAVDVGPVTTDSMGVSGEAIIIAARLVEAPTLKEAIAKSTAKLGLIASPFVYETAIRHTPNPVDLAGYSQVQVKIKGFTIPAWIKLFGVPVSSSYFSRPTSDLSELEI
jgi:cyclic nucleotide-binding protein